MKIGKCIMGKIDASVGILILSIALFCWTTISSADSSSEETNYITTEWTVSEGDSIWSIASKNRMDDELPIEQLVEWISMENNIENGKIYPGQKIDVPIQLHTFASNN
ncbi:LysM peptidoglycan-binding domain-containing protein [Evansella sp. AB-P1]|uniref:cell division suppressor protein YneA n=1 Tax=Evansella sp. AB-P1 TaxID=3037653 RepID=UPI00241E3FDF|nr:LysM peptidoglycan-binding domain-containing protein [Evansella sp. AB-P1]MDG5789045.1 LysM peptidoglycan-binding domain-containing protein [Evansella sp. AB-P1]